MKKRTFYMEFSYMLGLAALALGATFLVRADFGVSVVVAPAYLLHLKLSQTWSFVTFGVAEYMVQGFLLLLLMGIVRRFHWSYLFSFITALLYGRILDLFLTLTGGLVMDALWLRLLFFLLGLLFGAFGVSLILHTYVSPEVYELMLKELSAKFNWEVGKLKITYDLISCTAAVVMSFVFFGLFHFEGVKLGTIISALVNGILIWRFNCLFEGKFHFQAAWPRMKRYFVPPEFPQKDSPLPDTP